MEKKTTFKKYFSIFEKYFSIVAKYCLIIIFAFLVMYVLELCIFSDFIAEPLIARALPVSILAVAVSILYFSLEYNAKIKKLSS